MSVAAAGATVIGNIIDGLFQSSAQNSANETNIQLSRENRDFMQHMSNSAHQRAVVDLKNAGLNPILAANSGASTPTPNTPVVDPVNPMAGVGKGMSAGVSTALEAMKTEADVTSKGAGAALATAQTTTEAARALQTANSAKESAARTQQITAELPGRAAKSQYEKQQSDIDRDNIVYDNIMKRAQQAAGLGSSALEMVNPLKGLLKGKSSGWNGKSKDLFDYMNKRRTP